MTPYSLIQCVTVILLSATTQCCAPVVCAAQPAQPKPQTEVRNADTAVGKLLAPATGSYQRWLRDTSGNAKPLLVGLKRFDVESALDKRHCVAIAAWSDGDQLYKWYRLNMSGSAFPPNVPLNAFLLVSASHDKPDHASVIVSAEVSLGVLNAAPYSKTLRSFQSHKHLLLGRILACEQVKSDGETWPILKKIMIHYGPHQYRSSPFKEVGFHADVEFAASTTEDIGGKTVGLFIASNLDPATINLTGKETIFPPGTKRQDTLGEVQDTYGAGPWWNGDPATAAENQRRYLKPKPSSRR